MSDTEQPAGWKRNVSIVLWLVVAGMILAWIWLGDWRWGATAGLLSVFAFVLFGLSFSESPKDQRQSSQWN